MANSKEGSKFDDAFEMTQYKKRFEDAVADAQYMMMYASSNCPRDIDEKTIEKLIVARRRIENGEALSAKDEANFWIAYQVIWKLVHPATAESIKANMPLETTLIGRLLGSMPFLSQWAEKWIISRSRRTVNGYIAFTVLVLALLLAFQIYWVVGNQLIAELGAVSQSEEFLNTQMYENEQELIALKIRFEQNEADSKRAISENESAKARLETNLKALKSKQERYSAILRVWSKPWSWFIKVENITVEHSDKYKPQFDEIDTRLKEIDNQLNNDPSGIEAATLMAHQTTLKDQLTAVDVELSAEKDETKRTELLDKKTSIQEQIDTLFRKSDLDAQLVGFEASKKDIQTQIDSLEADLKRENYQSRIVELEETKKATQGQLDFFVAEKQNSRQLMSELENTKQALVDILTPRSGDSKTPLTEEEIRTLPVDIQPSLADKQADAEAQVEFLNEYKKYIEGQISDYLAYSGYVDEQISGYEAYQQDIAGQINDMTVRDAELNAKIKKLKSDKQAFEQNIKNLENQIKQLGNIIDNFSVLVTPEQAQEIVDALKKERQNLVTAKDALESEEQAYFDQIDSRPAQLVGQFVLNILQNYLLPILYGLLGAGTSVLRSLSRKIKDVTYSEVTGIQHLLSISLGALAGIMVGWFSFLIDTGTTTFLGSVSPLAIAFLVGYNIDPFFSRMDVALKINEASQQTMLVVEKDAKPKASDALPQNEKKPRSVAKKTKTSKQKNIPE